MSVDGRDTSIQVFDKFISLSMQTIDKVLLDRTYICFAAVCSILISSKVHEGQSLLTVANFPHFLATEVVAFERMLLSKIRYQITPLSTPSSFVRRLLALLPEHSSLHANILEQTNLFLSQFVENSDYVAFAPSTVAIAVLLLSFATWQIDCRLWLSRIPNNCLPRADNPLMIEEEDLLDIDLCLICLHELPSVQALTSVSAAQEHVQHNTSDSYIAVPLTSSTVIATGTHEQYNNTTTGDSLESDWFMSPDRNVPTKLHHDNKISGVSPIGVDAVAMNEEHEDLFSSSSSSLLQSDTMRKDNEGNESSLLTCTQGVSVHATIPPERVVLNYSVSQSRKRARNSIPTGQFTNDFPEFASHLKTLECTTLLNEPACANSAEAMNREQKFATDIVHPNSCQVYTPDELDEEIAELLGYNSEFGEGGNNSELCSKNAQLIAPTPITVITETTEHSKFTSYCNTEQAAVVTEDTACTMALDTPMPQTEFVTSNSKCNDIIIGSGARGSLMAVVKPIACRIDTYEI